MFTGIVTDYGKIRKIEKAGDTTFEIGTVYKAEDIEIGASIACNGVCLTVIESGHDKAADENWFRVQASGETLDVTTLSDIKEGDRLNLERALRMGDEMGGHIVSGHVDGIAEVTRIAPEGDSLRFSFRVPERLKKFIASKGSVSIDGVSLTVNEVEQGVFGVNIIPHTQKVTAFGAYKEGTKVNMEIDMLARYVARLMEDE